MAAPKNKLDLVGRRFGMLVVQAIAGTDSRQETLWVCRCDCGGVSVVPAQVLKSGRVKSCGCLIGPNAKNAYRAIKPYIQNHTHIALIRSKKINKNNKCGVKGICWVEKKRAWLAQIMLKGKRYSHQSKEFESSVAWRNKKVKELFEPIISAYEESTEK